MIRNNIRAFVMIWVIVVLGIVAFAHVNQHANATSPPWGNTLEGRVNHLESELNDLNGDVIYANAHIRQLHTQVDNLRDDLAESNEVMSEYKIEMHRVIVVLQSDLKRHEIMIAQLRRKVNR